MSVSAVFIIVYCFISKDALICAIPLQSLFFVLALTKSGILLDLSKEQSQVSFSRLSLIKGTMLIMTGFALSLVLIILFENTRLFDFAALSFLIMSLYFCFYGLHSVMLLCGKKAQNIKLITVICTLFPCIANISGFYAKSCISLALFLLTIGGVLLYVAFTLAQGCTHTRKTK